MQLWTDDNVPGNLVNQEIYHQTVLPAQKVDILRHEILNLFGGVYIDVDFECLRNIEPLVDEASYFYADQLPGTPGIGILGSTPNHPFTRWCLKWIPERWPWQPGHILAETGPAFFRRAVLRYMGNHVAVPLVDPLSGRLAGNKLVAEWGPPLHALLPWVVYPYYMGNKWIPAEHADAYAAHHWHGDWG